MKNKEELLAKAFIAYHLEVAKASECEPEDLTSQLTIYDDKYIYKIVITADPLDDTD